MSSLLVEDKKRKKRLNLLRKNLNEIIGFKDQKQDLLISQIKEILDNNLCDYEEIIKKSSKELVKLRKANICLNADIYMNSKGSLNFKITNYGLTNMDLAELFHYQCLVEKIKPTWLRTHNASMPVNNITMKIKLTDTQFQNSNCLLPSLSTFFDKCTYPFNNEDLTEHQFWKPFGEVNMTNAYEIQNYPQLDDEVLALRGQQLKPFLLLTNNQMLTLNYFLPGQNCNSFIIPTRDVYDKVNSNSPLFAIDCEMVHTENNPQALARVALISETGQVILDTLVKPEAKVINYLTQYSGIEPGMLDQVHVTLQHVQQFLIKFLPPDAILVGHTVNCDLDALGLYHPYVADVSALYNNTGKIGQRKSLVYLAQNYLGINCQSGNAHCPFEDAYVALLLFKEKMTHGIAHGNYFYSSRLAAVETTDEVEHQEEVSVGNNALSLENEASDEPAVKRRCEASVKVEKIYSICKNCQALIGVPCILKDCICLSSKVELCVKCFIDWRQIPAANECDNNGSWRDITRIDVGKAKTRKLSECLELKQNTKLGHRVMFAGRQFKDIVATSKYIHFLEREKLKSESEILDTLRYQTFDFSSMAISLDIREDVDIESFNLSLQWLIDGVMKNGLLVCVLDSPKAKCLYLKSK